MNHTAETKPWPTKNVQTIIAEPAAVQWCNKIHHSCVSRPKTQKTRRPHCWGIIRKPGWEAPPFQWCSQTLREELKARKANLSIPQIELGEPKQTIASWASARKLGKPSVCNKTLLGSLSEWLAAANQQGHTGTIKAVVTNRQTGCSCSVANLNKNPKQTVCLMSAAPCPDLQVPFVNQHGHLT